MLQNNDLRRQTRLTLTFHRSVVAELILLPEISQKYGQAWMTEAIAMLFFFSLRSFLAEYLSLYELLIPNPFLPLTYCTFS